MHRTPAILKGMTKLADGEVDRFVGDAPLITDDCPRTEYYMVNRVLNFGRHQNVNYAMLRQLWGSP
jgi:hypothetical protein